MQTSVLLHSIAIIQFYFKTISIFLKNKLLILQRNFLIEDMIQRIQTLYLFLSVVISAGLIFVFHLWTNTEDVKVFAINDYLYLSLFLASALLSLIAIFSFKNRKSQFVMGRLNIILNFILLGIFVYQSLNISGETNVSEKGIGILLPIFSIVCLVLANKAIKKDEDLVKSVDRLR